MKVFGRTLHIPTPFKRPNRSKLNKTDDKNVNILKKAINELTQKANGLNREERKLKDLEEVTNKTYRLLANPMANKNDNLLALSGLKERLNQIGPMLQKDLDEVAKCSYEVADATMLKEEKDQSKEAFKKMNALFEKYAKANEGILNLQELIQLKIKEIQKPTKKQIIDSDSDQTESKKETMETPIVIQAEAKEDFKTDPESHLKSESEITQEPPKQTPPQEKASAPTGNKDSYTQMMKNRPSGPVGRRKPTRTKTVSNPTQNVDSTPPKAEALSPTQKKQELNSAKKEEDVQEACENAKKSVESMEELEGEISNSSPQVSPSLKRRIQQSKNDLDNTFKLKDNKEKSANQDAQTAIENSKRPRIPVTPKEVLPAWKGATYLESFKQNSERLETIYQEIQSIPHGDKRLQGFQKQGEEYLEKMKASIKEMTQLEVETHDQERHLYTQENAFQLLLHGKTAPVKNKGAWEKPLPVRPDQYKEEQPEASPAPAPSSQSPQELPPKKVSSSESQEEGWSQVPYSNPQKERRIQAKAEAEAEEQHYQKSLQSFDKICKQLEDKQPLDRHAIQNLKEQGITALKGLRKATSTSLRDKEIQKMKDRFNNGLESKTQQQSARSLRKQRKQERKQIFQSSKELATAYLLSKAFQSTTSKEEAPSQTQQNGLWSWLAALASSSKGDTDISLDSLNLDDGVPHLELLPATKDNFTERQTAIEKKLNQIENNLTLPHTKRFRDTLISTIRYEMKEKGLSLEDLEEVDSGLATLLKPFLSEKKEHLHDQASSVKADLSPPKEEAWEEVKSTQSESPKEKETRQDANRNFENTVKEEIAPLLSQLEGGKRITEQQAKELKKKGDELIKNLDESIETLKNLPKVKSTEEKSRQRQELSERLNSGYERQIGRAQNHTQKKEQLQKNQEQRRALLDNSLELARLYSDSSLFQEEIFLAGEASPSEPQEQVKELQKDLTRLQQSSSKNSRQEAELMQQTQDATKKLAQWIQSDCQYFETSPENFDHDLKLAWDKFTKAIQEPETSKSQELNAPTPLTSSHPELGGEGERERSIQLFNGIYDIEKAIASSPSGSKWLLFSSQLLKEVTSIRERLDDLYDQETETFDCPLEEMEQHAQKVLEKASPTLQKLREEKQLLAYSTPLFQAYQDLVQLFPAQKEEKAGEVEGNQEIFTASQIEKIKEEYEVKKSLLEFTKQLAQAFIEDETLQIQADIPGEVDELSPNQVEADRILRRLSQESAVNLEDNTIQTDQKRLLELIEESYSEEAAYPDSVKSARDPVAALQQENMEASFKELKMLFNACLKQMAESQDKNSFEASQEKAEGLLQLMRFQQKSIPDEDTFASFIDEQSQNMEEQRTSKLSIQSSLISLKAVLNKHPLGTQKLLLSSPLLQQINTLQSSLMNHFNEENKSLSLPFSKVQKIGQEAVGTVQAAINEGLENGSIDFSIYGTPLCDQLIELGKAMEKGSEMAPSGSDPTVAQTMAETCVSLKKKKEQCHHRQALIGAIKEAAQAYTTSTLLMDEEYNPIGGIEESEPSRNQTKAQRILHSMKQSKVINSTLNELHQKKRELRALVSSDLEEKGVSPDALKNEDPQLHAALEKKNIGGFQNRNK